MNANSSHCSKYPLKVAFPLPTNFSDVFRNLFNNFVNRKFWHVILYAYTEMLEFPGQVLELSMPVGRGTKGPLGHLWDYAWTDNDYLNLRALLEALL